jgi:hypothetical protein
MSNDMKCTIDGCDQLIAPGNRLLCKYHHDEGMALIERMIELGKEQHK